MRAVTALALVELRRRALFWLRLGSVFASLVLFAGGVLAFHLRTPAELADVFGKFSDPGTGVLAGGRGGPAWFRYLAFGGDAWTAVAVLGLFVFGVAAVSAVASSAGRALRSVMLGTAGLALALTLVCPDGLRFAWEASGAGVLAVVDAATRQVSTVPLPRPTIGMGGGAWLDARHFVTVEAVRGRPPVRWWVVDTATGESRGPFTAPEASGLVRFTLRYRGRPALLEDSEGGHRLFVLSEDGTALEPVATVGRGIEAPGELPDGSLVWIADLPAGGGQGAVVRRLRPGGSLAEGCRLPPSGRSGGWHFVEAAGDWAVWVEGGRVGVASLFELRERAEGGGSDVQVRLCNLSSGEVRSVRVTGPLAEAAIDLTPNRLVGPGLEIELGPDR